MDEGNFEKSNPPPNPETSQEMQADNLVDEIQQSPEQVKETEENFQKLKDEAEQSDRQELQQATQELDSIFKNESSRAYEPSPVIANEISQTKMIFEKPIGHDTKVCLIGDGQGMDTEQFLDMGVDPQNIQSVNYEQSEVDQANQGALKDSGVEMKQGDITSIESLKEAGIEEGSQEIVTLMHVLEVPSIKGENEKRLVENVVKILKSDGEVLASQYKHKFTKEERELQEKIGIEEIKLEDMQKQFGDDWQEEFKKEYGVDWEQGMRYGEISNIRTKEELKKLFELFFEVKIDESEQEYILKMKKK